MKYTPDLMSAQSSSRLVAAASIFLAAGAYHYAVHGWDLRTALPLPARYDAARDPGEDIVNGLAQARAEHKRVLLEVGGDWCPPCMTMDRLLRDDEGLARMTDDRFVLVRVAVPQNDVNIPALRGLPDYTSFPHLFVLESDGRLVVSKDTDDLEAGDSYDRARFAVFLDSNTLPYASAPEGAAASAAAAAR
jgi:thiol:disulfide interchange protein